MSSSDLSELSSSLSTDEDVDVPISKGTLEHYFKGQDGSGATSKPPSVKRKRPSSPPHEYVLADNPDIAFICMFRSRFNDTFPKSLPHYGPQDIENGVVGAVPGEQVERLLCALLGLVLNRKKDVEKGHYTRALEEAVQTHAGQWSPAWQGRNPLHGGGSFNNMTPEQRLTLLKNLILWSLGSSEAVQAIMKESYKRSRQDDDLNQPLSVQPWGRDGDKRRYWLIEGQDDTHFRLYRESKRELKSTTWRSIAGTIDEVKSVAENLGEESSILSRRLKDRILAAIPRFEASEDKRKRRDYRLARKAQFTRPDPGFSLYEGRTRGKRLKYTFSDDEDGGSDNASTRRSNRQSGVSTPAENGPTFTASGRQVRSRYGGAYGESIPTKRTETSESQSNGALNGVADGDVQSMAHGLPQGTTHRGRGRPRGRPKTQNGDDDSLGSMDDESNVTSSGGEWEGGEEDEADDRMDDDEDDEDTEMSDGIDEDEENQRQSLVVSLRYLKNQPAPSVDLARSNGVKDPATVSNGASFTSASPSSAPPQDVAVEKQNPQMPVNGIGPAAPSNSEHHPLHTIPVKLADTERATGPSNPPRLYPLGVDES